KTGGPARYPREPPKSRPEKPAIVRAAPSVFQFSGMDCGLDAVEQVRQPDGKAWKQIRFQHLIVFDHHFPVFGKDERATHLLREHPDFLCPALPVARRFS